MRILFLSGKRGKLLDKIIPRSYWTSNDKATIKRLNWIISLMEKDTGKSIETLK
jgi:hypothetical protein